MNALLSAPAKDSPSASGPGIGQDYSSSSLGLSWQTPMLLVDIKPIEIVSTYEHRQTYTGEIRAQRTSDLGFQRSR
jgi:hypothetical protein